MTMEINKTVNAYKTLKLEIEQKKAQLDQLAKELQAELDAQNTNELYGKTWKIKRSVFNQTRLDTKRLKIELPDIYTNYSMTVATSRFTVS